MSFSLYNRHADANMAEKLAVGMIPQPPPLPSLNIGNESEGDPGAIKIEGPGSSSNYEEDQMVDSDVVKVRRAKSRQKITRNRKITSCLQCRERKQKCDRLRPVCSNCMTSNSRGGMCTYIDEKQTLQDSASHDEDDEKPTKRQRQSLSPPDEVNKALLYPARPALPARSPLTIRRLNLIEATATAGKDKSLDFDVRVRYARAAAIGSVLFGTPSSAESLNQVYSPLAAVDSLKLPTVAEIGPLLDTYKRHVEWMCNVVIVDLNRARFESFLNWWHSRPQTLPADPPLIPLVLTILALAIQARRMAPHCTIVGNSDQSKHKLDDVRQGPFPDDKPPRLRGVSPRDPYLKTCSSEKELMETAQRCIDVLQIACPSNWASAFSAPLDLVRASLLRGLWHLTELHLQFAGSCLAATMRLAHAASLNHDTRHWPSMGREESQARRNIFWNVVTFEFLFSVRVIQPSTVMPHSYDTSFPDNYEALLNLYRYGGLIEPHVVEGRRSRFRATPVTEESFNFHLVRFQLTDVMVKGQDLLRTGDKSKLAEAHAAWRANLPGDMQRFINADLTRHPHPFDGEHDGEVHYLQAAMLQLLNLGALLQIHRPQADESGRWRAPDGQAQRSLDLCINAAQRLITLVHAIVLRDPGPPYVLYHQCIFQCFQAAIVIEIQSALSAEQGMSSSNGLGNAFTEKALITLDLIKRQEGLRNISEQAGRYAATLREIQATQQRAREQSRKNSRDAGDSNSSVIERNARRTALGVQSVAVVEGNGKMLGGQGYPTGDYEARPTRKHRIHSLTGKPAHPLPEMADATYNVVSAQDVGQSSGTSGAGAIPSIQAMNPLPRTTYGIDFDDLQVFSNANEQNPGARYFMFSEDSFADRSLASSNSMPSGNHPLFTRPGFYNLSTTATQQQDSIPPDMASISASSGPEGAVGLELLAATIPTAQQGSSATWDNSAMSFRDTFAMDWSEWERAVERLLYSEK